MKAISINHLLLIDSSWKLVRFLTFYKFFSKWRDREKRKFYDLYNQGKFSEALDFGEAALKKNEHDYNLRKSLASTYRISGLHDLADLKIVEGLSKVSEMSPDMIIDHIQKEITKALGNLEIESKIIDLGGMNNYCQVQHKAIDVNSQENNYITKISTPEKMKREHYFYSQICENNPKLKSIIPNFIGYFETENSKLAFLTTDEVRGSGVKLEHIQPVIKVHELLSSFRFDLANGKFNYSFDRASIMLNFRRNDIRPRVFSTIHHQETNLLIIKWLHQRISTRKSALSHKVLINKLESIIIDEKLWEKIIPSRHFSFVHGDFGPHNLLMNDQNGRIYVIDWAGYFFGPAKFDMIRFFESYPLNFSDIKQKYIDNVMNEDCNDSVMEVSLFVYLLVTSWFKEKTIDRVLGNIDDYLAPAIEYLECLTQKIN